ncbi:MAG TPA: phage baseplate assembly protein V [Symbiobacteriaceae bacterium]|jgi:uncharacterized protein involved in type VI secretion and phage assembly|nr:phage baseplate assembly protein V [Symbiobacteriaceae bacterium]
MSDLVALLRQLVQAELAKMSTSAIGVVEAAGDHADGDTANYGCDVRLRGRDVVFAGVPIATDHLGTVALPNKGDVVLLQFVGGDQSQPVIVGRLYSEALRAPAYAANEIHTWLPPDAGESDQIQLDVVGGGSGKRSWSLKMPSDLEITVADKKVEVKVKNLTVTLDGDGGEATLKSQSGTVTVKDGGDVKVEAGGNLELSAKGNVEISASGNLTLKASANAELKGAMVSLGS